MKQNVGEWINTKVKSKCHRDGEATADYLQEMMELRMTIWTYAAAIEGKKKKTFLSRKKKSLKMVWHIHKRLEIAYIYMKNWRVIHLVTLESNFWWFYFFLVEGFFFFFQARKRYNREKWSSMFFYKEKCKNELDFPWFNRKAFPVWVLGNFLQ